MLSDEQIIAKVLKGRTDGFADLIARHQAAVYRLAFSMLANRDDAEDAAQETFMKVYQHLSTYRGHGQFWPWVRRITINICLKKTRREFPSDEIELLLDSSCPYNDPVESAVLRQAKSQDIRRIIDGLPAKYRSVVVLRFDENLTGKEIAELLDEQLSTVKVRLHRAEKLLAVRLKAVIEDEVL